MHVNKGLLCKENTCPPRLGFLKETPIWKRFGLQGKGPIFDYYKNPSTLARQGTHNLPLSSTLEL